MIETFFLDWPFCFGTGLLFGIAGRAEIARAASPYATRAFRWGFAYLNLGIVSVALAFYLLRPDWMWMYWVRDVPIVVVAMAFALYEVCFIAGFALGPGLGARKPLTIGVIAGSLVAFTAGEVSTRTRLFHLGTAAEFARGAPPEIRFSPFHMSALGWVVMGVVPVSIVALAWLAWNVATDRRAASPS